MTMTMSKKSISLSKVESAFRSEIKVLDDFPSAEDFCAELGAELVLVYDEVLPLQVKGFKHWIRSFPNTLEVKSGEKLKSIEEFPKLLTRIVHLSENFTRKNLVLVSVGGGSVGDFVGFVASILKRGVRLVHVPTTWLAVIDSAHGGKTALNVEGSKNQVGTFYPADVVYIIHSFFGKNSDTFAENALGELFKMALVDGGSWSSEILSSDSAPHELFKKYFLKAIEAKLKVVDTDPFEVLGKREVLNLGHSLGHVIESHYGYPHGVAVSHGLLFSLEWSAQLKLLPEKKLEPIKTVLEKRFSRIFKKYPKQSTMDASRFISLLARDKKLGSKSQLNFIFIKDFGNLETRTVPFNLMLQEAIRQGWVKA